jgi:hypothetical protein
MPLKPDRPGVWIDEEEGLGVSGNNLEHLRIFRLRLFVAGNVVVGVFDVELDDGCERLGVLGDLREVNRLQRHRYVVVDVEDLDEHVQTRRERNGAVVLGVDRQPVVTLTFPVLKTQFLSFLTSI